MHGIFPDRAWCFCYLAERKVGGMDNTASYEAIETAALLGKRKLTFALYVRELPEAFIRTLAFDTMMIGFDDSALPEFLAVVAQGIEDLVEKQIDFDFPENEWDDYYPEPNEKFKGWYGEGNLKTLEEMIGGRVMVSFDGGWMTGILNKIPDGWFRVNAQDGGYQFREEQIVLPIFGRGKMPVIRTTMG